MTARSESFEKRKPLTLGTELWERCNNYFYPLPLSQIFIYLLLNHLHQWRHYCRYYRARLKLRRDNHHVMAPNAFKQVWPLYCFTVFNAAFTNFTTCLLCPYKLIPSFRGSVSLITDHSVVRIKNGCLCQSSFSKTGVSYQVKRSVVHECRSGSNNSFESWW